MLGAVAEGLFVGAREDVDVGGRHVSGGQPRFDGLEDRDEGTFVIEGAAAPDAPVGEVGGERLVLPPRFVGGHDVVMRHQDGRPSGSCPGQR